jgi:hypothetical protein
MLDVLSVEYTGTTTRAAKMDFLGFIDKSLTKMTSGINEDFAKQESIELVLNKHPDTMDGNYFFNS